MQKYIVSEISTFDSIEEARAEAIRRAEEFKQFSYSVCEVVETYSIVSSVQKTYEREATTPTTCQDGTEGVFIDSRNGKSYKTLWIGGKEWMNENLEYLPEGKKLSPPGEWSEEDIGLISQTEDGENGYLYQWRAAMECCPEGWHLPSKQELEEANLSENQKWNRTYAGYRYFDSVGTFYYRASNEYLWSSTASSASGAWNEGFYTSVPSSSNRVTSTNAYGFSARYVRD